MKYILIYFFFVFLKYFKSFQYPQKYVYQTMCLEAYQSAKSVEQMDLGGNQSYLLFI